MCLRCQESLGNVTTTKAAYNRAIDLKVATPQMIINFAAFLEDKGYFEDSFKVCAVLFPVSSPGCGLCELLVYFA